ncbi:MAG: hypothetical protein JRN21_05705 [Nitrososphaerota archaeon]|nr:hypothetical protein [Nitrososphaerota archaeon]
MVRRSGIAASAASAVVFSLLLLSSLAVYASSQGRASLYAQANAEDSAADGFRVMELTGAANVLYMVQEALSASPLACPTANQTASAAIASASYRQRAGNMTVVVQARPAGSSGEGDNLTALAPLDGGVAGDVNIALHVSATGGASPDVSFNRTEVHVVHLGVRLPAAVSDCGAAFRAVSEALDGSGPVDCSYSSVEGIVDAAAGSPGARARADGFSFGVSYSVTDASGCSVAYSVQLSQAGVEGLGGEFGVSFEESGQASLTPLS